VIDEVRAILFDFGGVVLTSPFEAFAAYEASAKLPAGVLAKINTINPDTNAWAQMERAEIDEAEFYRRFEEEGRALGFTFDAKQLVSMLSGEIRSEMVEVVRHLRERYTVACLTNNMVLGHGTAMSRTPVAAAEVADVMALFEFVIESRELRVRKPEPRFFVRACEIIGVAPAQCVLLDDLGINLKTARQLGMTTIKVVEPGVAIAELEAVLGHGVRGW
jgi:putative hydrolase of the HAD superfamily